MLVLFKGIAPQGGYVVAFANVLYTVIIYLNKIPYFEFRFKNIISKEVKANFTIKLYSKSYQTPFF